MANVCSTLTLTDRQTHIEPKMDAATDADIGVKVMWRPDPTRITHMDKFRRSINEKYDVNLQSYSDLYQWSIDSYAEFWEEFWHYAGIISSRNYDQVIDKKKRIDEIPEWFSGCRFNFAQNLLKYKDDRTAIYYVSEAHPDVQRKSFLDLHNDVARYAATMRRMGIRQGDRVVGYLPNCVEAVVAMLATASIGAIWSSTSPDFGVSGVLDRFTQIQPRLIFSVNAVVYNGKTHNHLEKLVQVVKGLPDLEKVVIVPYVGERNDSEISHIKNSCYLEDFLKDGLENGSVPDLEFEQLPFNHPMFIMYSSGTTGAPKCMVHSTGGTLIQHLKEHILHGNMNWDDKMLYYTTTGWMMWNWFVSALGVGSAIVLYDGSPLIPGPHVLWDLIDNIGISILGTSAKWLAVLEERGLKPRESHNLSSLTTILSTGSPLKPQTYEYVYRDIKQDLLLGSISGGTDLISCFAGQNWTIPVYKGEIQAPNLGMAIESWNEDGKSVIGESGELVCLQPFPCMPTHFWNDLEGHKYQKAYFTKFEGVWAHGDFCKINPDNGGILMLGRSDGTLNPNGVRFGSAEIYNIVEAFKEIQDSVCVGQRSKNGMEERVILFLKMVAGVEFTEALVRRLRTEIRMQLSARHVPTLILQTADIPYTQSGKKVEVAIKKIISGTDIKQRGAYANPESLDLYYNIPELGDF